MDKEQLEKLVKWSIHDHPNHFWPLAPLTPEPKPLLERMYSDAELQLQITAAGKIFADVERDNYVELIAKTKIIPKGVVGSVIFISGYSVLETQEVHIFNQVEMPKSDVQEDNFKKLWIVAKRAIELRPPEKFGPVVAKLYSMPYWARLTEKNGMPLEGFSDKTVYPCFIQGLVTYYPTRDFISRKCAIDPESGFTDPVKGPGIALNESEWENEPFPLLIGAENYALPKIHLN